MKTKNLFALSLILGVGAFISCSNDDKDTDNLKFTPLESLSATIEGQGSNTLRSKLVYEDNEYKTVFTAGNEVLLTDLSGNTATFANSEANVNVFTNAGGEVPSETDLYAGYPASAFSVTGSTITYQAPETQTYTADANGYIAEGTCPLMAKSSTGAFDFKNLDCLLKINVKTSSESETFNVTSIKLTTKSGALSGSFTADYNSGNPTLTAVEGSSSNAVSLNCGDGVEIDNEDKTFYIAVPAGTYDGLQVQVRLSNGYVYIDKARTEKTFTRSKFYTTSITVGATPTTGVQTCVDLGLPSGTLWATCNVGASSSTEYGDYFAWGETSPKDEFYPDNYKWSEDEECTTYTKYISDDAYGTVDNKTILESADDAATANWGYAFRMPTITEFKELIENCTWTWNVANNGYIVASKKDANSIFLPAAGNVDLDEYNDLNVYWSASLNKTNSACVLCFISTSISTDSFYRGSSGCSVRAVVDK